MAGGRRLEGIAVAIPLSMRASDLPKRAASAAVMLAIAGSALWTGGYWFDAFVIAIALACLFELVRMIRRAAKTTACWPRAWAGTGCCAT